eukprot:scaffold14508_cov72-Phaeocystis_antarctica.AAC.7
MLLDAVRGGVASVSRTLQEFERAHEVGRQGDELASARLLPWRTLGEQFSILEATLQERILQVSVVETFRPELARVQRPGDPKHILPGCLPMAQASLEADPALAALRYGLVPATLSEEDCACHRSSNLDTRTALVATALQSLTRSASVCAGSLALLLLVTQPKPCSRQAPRPIAKRRDAERFPKCPAPAPLLNDFASANRARRTAVLADDAALELDVDATRGQDTRAAAAAAPPQDDGFVELTVDAEFERLVGGEA